jgi:L-threonylcarbamoyladenylate synthase
MVTLPVVAADALEDALAPAVACLARGGLIAYPTDTLYGLGVDPRRHDAVARLLQIKGRAAGAAIPLIAASISQVDLVGDLTAIGRRIAAHFWPGPLTLVIRVTAPIDPAIHQSLETVAIRVPADPVARALANGLGFPLTSTSANLSGQPPAATAAAVRAAFGEDLDMLVDGGPSVGGPPSTIVDVVSGHPRLLRAGAVPWDRVLEFFELSRDA